MRDPLRLDLTATAALAAATFAALCYLAPSYARARRLGPVEAAAPAESVTWSPGARRAPLRVMQAQRLAARPNEEPASDSACTGRDDRDDRSGLEGVHTVSGSGPRSRVFSFDDHYIYGHRGYHRYGRYRRYRRYPRRAGMSQQPVMSWVGGSQAGRGASVCELLPALCGSGGAARATATSAESPEVMESPERITLSNEHMAIDVARVGRCSVRVHRAEERAETLLTFDVPDELVPCQARVVPDVFHDDGVALRVDAAGAGWSQSVTLSLGADDREPSVTVSRATREGDATAHALVNASPNPVTFTLDGDDFTAEPGEVLTLASR